MDTNNEEVQFELFPFIRLYKSGRIERLLETEVLPATIDPHTGVASKDIVIDSNTGISARLYLPNRPQKKLPILIYYHGGGFCIETAFSPTYHNYLNSLVSQAHVVAVSVDYRRVPEHRLPIAYDDSWTALKWVASATEPWLAEYGDFERVFLAGDSAGANIAHHMALRAGTDELGVSIRGVALVHPYFGGAEPVGSESWGPESMEIMERMWRIVCPSTVGVDDPFLNPLGERAPSLAGLACERVMVSVAEKDFLRERGRAYYKRLKESGWKGEVELLESEGVDHVFHLRNPTCEKAVAKMERMVAFLNSDVK